MIKKTLFVLLVLVLSFTSLQAGEAEDLKVLQAAKTLKELLHLPENAIAPLLFKEAHAIAIIPGAIKVGLLFGGQFGDGVICVKDENGVWGNPVFITLATGSFGFQFGASSSDLVIAFKTRKAVDGLITSKLTLGVDASLAVGSEGRDVGANGDIFLQQEVYTYARSKGLYAGVSLEGSSLMVDEAANMRYYGKAISPTDIFNNFQVTAPSSAVTLSRFFNGN